MESRNVKVIITSPGGSASRNAESFRVTIPNQWARKMNITKEDREVTLSFDNNRIIIEKNK